MNNFTQPRGDRNSSIAIVGYKPTEEDEQKGTVFMGTAGWHLDKVFQKANLPVPYFLTFQPLNSIALDEIMCRDVFIQQGNKYPFIVPVDGVPIKGEAWYSKALHFLCPETKGIISKYVGSLLKSPFIPWPHYVFPLHSPAYVWKNYEEFDIQLSLDLAWLKEDVDYWIKNGKLQDLPQRTLITNPSYPELIDFLVHLHGVERISNDIETIRPNKESIKFKHHPGYPYTISLASSSSIGISFPIWDYTTEQTVKIFRELDWIFRNIPQIGQNFFLFDTLFYEALGFRIDLSKCSDTRIRHHILHPELPHSLQFQTRQYTREPYYKDEGKNWSPKYKGVLMRYNALDTTVTYEVWERQEEELNDRSYLK